MTKAASNNVVVSLDMSVSVGRKTYKLADLIAHTAKQYDTLYLLQEEQLGLYKAIGEALLQIKALFGQNDRAFGEWIAKTELGSMSRQDRTDAMFIAANWTKVQKLNKGGKLDSLGVSAIRKRVKAAEQPKAAAAGNVSKGKPKALTQADITAKLDETSTLLPSEAFTYKEPMTEAELAKQVFDQIQTYGLDFKVFAMALADLRKAS